MIIVPKTLFCQSGSHLQVNLSTQDILDSTPQGQYIKYMDMQDLWNYPNDLDYLQEDGHSYQIIDSNNIDSFDLDVL